MSEETRTKDYYIRCPVHGEVKVNKIQVWPDALEFLGEDHPEMFIDGQFITGNCPVCDNTRKVIRIEPRPAASKPA